ncbi:hypothetical protein [Desulfatitalea alkaliphila]|uniref:Uncharacterized protein n=1 Tax=Desulfatitalea alkaliphila TaxID=2929485 RepID=A0AA41UJ86_9BACT|nr:hypothetical protein [Desulfatitalea alkaliphila]MCJ8499111.1 hypothetical protein [Desulfatitalea alkaliphila]
MPETFHYFVGHPPVPLRPGDTQWDTPIPYHRAATPGGIDKDDTCVTYGHYFTAVQAFLAADDLALPKYAIGRCRAGAACRQPQSIDIHLVKHGALYHPSRVTLAITGGPPLPLAVNVAVGNAGRERLSDEVRHLTHLCSAFPERYVPCVFGAGEGATRRLPSLPMFAVQWLDDYHEYHRTARDGSEAERRLVWDAERGPWCLSDRQTTDLFRRMVFILTYYFDPRTLAAIMEWHHAAGDFIVKADPDGAIDVRLITVRRYAPMLQLPADASPSVQTILDALALFLLRTTLWMRIDRLEGVGELVWAEDRWVAPMWEGFVQGIAAMAQVHRLPGVFEEGTLRYLAAHEPHDWERIGYQILDSYPAALPEALIIKHHLVDHIACLAAAVRSASAFGALSQQRPVTDRVE